MHESVGLNIQQDITLDHMELFADKYEVQIHMFDMNGIQPEFTFHSARRNYADDVFILQDMAHFHLISNIRGKLRNFRRSDGADFCNEYFSIKYSNRTHDIGSKQFHKTQEIGCFFNDDN